MIVLVGIQEVHDSWMPVRTSSISIPDTGPEAYA